MWGKFGGTIQRLQMRMSYAIYGGFSALHTDKFQFLTVFKVPPEEFKHCSEDQFAEILGGLYNNFEVKVMGPVELPSSTSWETNSEYSSR